MKRFAMLRESMEGERDLDGHSREIAELPLPPTLGKVVDGAMAGKIAASFAQTSSAAVGVSIVGSIQDKVSKSLASNMPDIAYVLRRPFERLRYVIEEYLARNSQVLFDEEVSRAEKKAREVIFSLRVAAASGLFPHYLDDNLGKLFDGFAGAIEEEELLGGVGDADNRENLILAVQSILDYPSPDPKTEVHEVLAALRTSIQQTMNPYDQGIGPSGVPQLDEAIVQFSKFMKGFVSLSVDAEEKIAVFVKGAEELTAALNIVHELRQRKSRGENEVRIPRPWVRLMMCMCATFAQRIDDHSVATLLKHYPVRYSTEEGASLAASDYSEAWSAPPNVVEDLLTRVVSALRYLSDPAFLLTNGFSMMIHLYVKFMDVINAMADSDSAEGEEDEMADAFVSVFSSFSRNISSAWVTLLKGVVGVIPALLIQARQQCDQLRGVMAGWGEDLKGGLIEVWKDICSDDASGRIAKKFQNNLIAAISSARSVPSQLYKLIKAAGTTIVTLKIKGTSIESFFSSSSFPNIKKLKDTVADIFVGTQNVFIALICTDKVQSVKLDDIIGGFARFKATTVSAANEMMEGALKQINDTYSAVRDYALIKYYTSGLDQVKNIRQYLPTFLNDIVQSYFAVFVGSSLTSTIADKLVKEEHYHGKPEEYQAAKDNLTVKLGIGAGVAFGVAAAAAIFVAVRSKLRGRRRRSKIISRQKSMRRNLRQKLRDSGDSPRK